MSNVGKAIYYILSNNSDVTDIVGDADTYRITPLFEPQTLQVPAITYQDVSNDPANTKTGASITDTETYQVNSYCEGSTAYEDAKDLAEKVRLALDFQAGTFNGVVIQRIFFQGQQIVWDDSSRNEGVCMVAQDYKIIVNR